MDTKFLADAMLGKLAKWLRVLGYDTLYQPFYRDGSMDELLQGGRLLITRDKGRIHKYGPGLFVESDHAGEQLAEMKKAGYLVSEESRWFSRCLLCNVPLRETSREDAVGAVPEYIFSKSKDAIRVCPSCGRHFWPGTHRQRMVEQLREWGF